MINKKGDIGLGVIIVIILIILFLGWLVSQGWKECRSNSECKDNQYCGSDFSCHEIPVIVKTEQVAPPVDYTSVAWIIGFCLIIAAIIMKWDVIFKRREKVIISEPAQGNETKPRAKIVPKRELETYNAEEDGKYTEDIEKEEI